MGTLRNCIEKAAKLIRPADAEALHARARAYVTDGHPVEKAEAMAVQDTIEETLGHLKSVHDQAGVPFNAAKYQPAGAVNIGPRDATVSTGTGVPTPTEDAIVAKVKADIAANQNSDVPTFKDVGFESQEAADKAYADGHLKEHFETQDEFLRRVFCMGQAA
jgi:hypothetical protein